jgi:hypothetical protein
VYREDVKTADGKIARRQRQVRLRTLAELPTKNAARTKLADILERSQPVTEITFRELVDRWKAAESPTLKDSTFDTYKKVLMARVMPTFERQTITNINREVVQNFLAGRGQASAKARLRACERS